MDFLNLKCDYCNSTIIYCDPIETFNSYVSSDVGIVEIKKVLNNVDNNYLVFRCKSCGAIIKYTFKDIEKNIRKNMCELMVRMVSHEQFKNISSVEHTEKIFVYCGRCNGWDGKGSCPVEIFEKCDLKRIPL